MTAKQKANRERFKKVVAEAKKLRKKNPKLTQAQAVKQAWAIMYAKPGKKVGATKIIQKGQSKNAKVTKVLEQTRTKKGQFKGYKRIAGQKTTGKSHSDSKSHNVNIKVVSGVPRAKKFITIPASEKAWFRKYVYGFYGKKGVQASSLLNNGFTRKELNARLNLFFKIQHDKGIDSWNRGDSIDRERFRDMFLMDQVKKGKYIY